MTLGFSYLYYSYSFEQVNLTFCELKGGTIGIVEKALETRYICFQSVADTVG